MTDDMGRVRQLLEESIDVELARTRVDIVVMGPGLSEESAAARLRRVIIDEAKEYGATIQPEHRGLVEAASAKLGSAHHLTAYEVHLVGISDLVVLIPASPGSLCELGLFSTYRRFSEKLLILASREHPRTGSYIADGPLTAARHNRAEVRYVEYADTSTAWGYVERRIQRVRVERSMLRLAEGG
jgi:hypothetical protein